MKALLLNRAKVQLESKTKAILNIQITITINKKKVKQKLNKNRQRYINIKNIYWSFKKELVNRIMILKILSYTLKN